MVLIATNAGPVQACAQMNLSRLFYLGLGWLSVALGIVGVILPVLPTTPFLLVAVWAFGKSSPVLAEKIRNHKTMGRYVVAWQDRGVIPLKAKILATLMMSTTAVYLWTYSPAPHWAAALACAIMLCAEIFILSRPSV
jgi:uncharacterized protein